MSRARDYSDLVGHAVVAYHSGGAASGPMVLVSITPGWFVFASSRSRDQFTIGRRGTVLRRY
jgi:hypothetical protein